MNPPGFVGWRLACLAAALVLSGCDPSQGRSRDASLHIFDLLSGQKVHDLRGHNRPTTAIAVSPDGMLALTASLTPELRLWSLQEPREIRSMDLSPPGRYIGPGNSVKFVKGTNLALVSHEQVGVSLWNLESNTLVRAFKGPIHDPSTVVMTPDDGTVLAVDSHGAVVVSWGLDDGTLRGVFSEQEIRERPFVTLARDGQSRSWWNPATGERWPEEKQPPAGNQVSSRGQAKLSPDGQRLLVYYGGVEDQPKVHWFRLWDIETGRLLWHLADLTLPIGHACRRYSSCESIAFSSDSQTLAVGMRDGRIEIREVEGGRLQQELKSPPGSCERVLFVPNGKQLLAWSDRTVRLWDVEAATLIRSLDVPYLCSVATTPDGRYLLVGGGGEFRGH